MVINSNMNSMDNVFVTEIPVTAPDGMVGDVPVVVGWALVRVIFQPRFRCVAHCIYNKIKTIVKHLID